MSFRKSAEWKPGLRSYFEYRNLGIVPATKGELLAHGIGRRAVASWLYCPVCGRMQ